MTNATRLARSLIAYNRLEGRDLTYEERREILNKVDTDELDSDPDFPAMVARIEATGVRNGHAQDAMRRNDWNAAMMIKDRS